jgi:glycosyltransferase involved in cell wall biosynthesis
MPVKILMLNALTEQSGSGVRFWSIARELAREGHSLCFLERSIAKNGRLERDGIRYRFTVETGFLWLDIFRATLLNLLHGLVFRPDYVFALKPMPNTCLPTLFIKKILKCKVIVDIDDLDFEYYPHGFRRELVRLFFKLFPRHFDVITTHNRYLKDFIIDELQIAPGKIYFLPQGIETRKFLKAQPDQRYREKWGINPRDKVIVYCASLGITSDFQHVLPMLVDFLRNSADVKILVIGDGKRKEYFVNKIEAYGLQERIIFTGYVPHGDMPGILKLARVGINYMAPTWANQCRASIKIREYLAAGLRVICNRVGDAELFKDYVTLCSTIEEFPAAMHQALIKQDLDSSRRGQEFVQRTFSWPPLVKGFVEYLERVAP